MKRKDSHFRLHLECLEPRFLLASAAVGWAEATPAEPALGPGFGHRGALLQTPLDEARDLLSPDGDEAPNRGPRSLPERAGGSLIEEVDPTYYPTQLTVVIYVIVIRRPTESETAPRFHGVIEPLPVSRPPRDDAEGEFSSSPGFARDQGLAAPPALITPTAARPGAPSLQGSSVLTGALAATAYTASQPSAPDEDPNPPSDAWPEEAATLLESEASTAALDALQHPEAAFSLRDWSDLTDAVFGEKDQDTSHSELDAAETLNIDPLETALDRPDTDAPTSASKRLEHDADPQAAAENALVESASPYDETRSVTVDATADDALLPDVSVTESSCNGEGELAGWIDLVYGPPAADEDTTASVQPPAVVELLHDEQERPRYQALLVE